MRLFQWMLVAAIAVALLSSEEDSPLNQWHVMSGWIVAVLIVFRLVWGFIVGERSRFADFIRPSQIGHHVAGLPCGQREVSLGHNPLGVLAVVVILALACATVATGAFGGGGDLHETLAWTLLAFVGVPVAAVVAMSLFERENLVRAMITGRKPASRHPEAVDARRPGVLGVMLGAAAVAGTVYAILQYDPQAFTPRGSGVFEHRADAAGATGYGQHQRHEDDDD